MTEWTTEQREVVEAPIDTKMVVSAGAGTGKTEALIGRIAHLLLAGQLQPGSEILILTFSRAAAGEIRRRLKTGEAAVGYVRVQTFDSYATKLLALYSEGVTWQTLTFDARVKRATDLVQVEQVRTSLRQIRHILVDEFQDLFEARVTFVGAILQACACGFTIFTDAAQSIYDFQVDKLRDPIRFDTLLRVLRTSSVLRTFSRNFRATSATARGALTFGPQLAAEWPQYERIGYDLQTLVYGLPGRTFEELVALSRSSPRKTAIVCRTNGEALWISARLHAAGVPHELRRAASELAVAGWLGAVLFDTPFTRVGRSAFTEAVARFASTMAIDADHAWTLVKRMDRTRSRDLDLAEVADAMRIGNVPDELTMTTPSDLVVSTVHRAKGLEFDRVALVGLDLDTQSATADGYADEVRVLYVALTRSRDEIIQITDISRVPVTLERNGRWLGRRHWRGRPDAIEVRGSDVHGLDPAGAWIEKDDAAATQTYIRDAVRPGHAVALTRVRSSLDGQPRALYRVDHNERLVGVTNETLGQAIYGAVGASARRTFPVHLEGVFVEGVDTVAGTSAAGRAAGLGWSGLWMRVRITGLGRFLDT